MEEDAPAPSPRQRGGHCGRPLPPLQAIRRSFPIDSPFFDEGNQDRDHLTKLASLPLSTPCPPSPSPSAPSTLFYCNVPHCTSSFSSLATFHSHYLTTHSHTCNACGRRFMSAHLLAVHQRERHSALWWVQRERGEGGYECLVEGCGWMGRRRDARRVHMVKKHGWDESFVFDERPAERTRRRTLKEKQRLWKDQHKGGTMEEEMGEGKQPGPVEVAMEQAQPSRLPPSPHLLQPSLSSSSSATATATLPSNSAAAAAALNSSASSSSSSRSPALRFAPRQVQLPQPPLPRPAASPAPHPSTLPILRTVDYRDAGEDGDSDNDATDRTGRAAEAR